MGFALDITYNYGVEAYDYEAGSGLRRFVLTMPSKLYKKAHKDAKKGKWTVREAPTAAFGERFVVTGPDGYMYEVRRVHFHYAVIGHLLFPQPRCCGRSACESRETEQSTAQLVERILAHSVHMAIPLAPF